MEAKLFWSTNVSEVRELGIRLLSKGRQLN